MRRPILILSIFVLMSLIVAFIGASKNPRGQTSFEVHWYGTAFQGACPNSVYADSGTPIYVYVSANSSGPWTYKRTDHVVDDGDYDVHFYQETSKPWIEFCVAQVPSDSDSVWLKNNNCNPVIFNGKKEAIRNQDIVRGF